MIARYRRVATASAALVSASAASAAELADTICKDAQTPVVSPAKLRSQALSGVSFEALDLNGDGSVTPDEVAKNLNDNTCGRGEKARCSKEDDLNLRHARNALDGFLENHPGIVIIPMRIPTAAELNADRTLASQRVQLVDLGNRFFRVTCSPSAMARNKEPAAHPTPQLPPVLIGKDLESLTAKRGKPGSDDRYKAVKQAEIGLTDDRVKNTKTVNVDGIAGLKFGVGPTSLIPFVQYTRARVKDKTNNTDKLSGKFGLGALATFYGGKDQFDIAPYFTRDLQHHSKRLTARIGWRPGFLYDLPSFNNAYHFACPRAPTGYCELGKGLALVTDAQLIASAGTVLDDGDDPKLSEGREFFRLGPSLTAQVYGMDGLFKDLSVDVSYKRLFRLAGDHAKIWSFKAGINYWVGGSDHLSIRYGYEIGRDEDTLEKTDVTKLGLGLRF